VSRPFVENHGEEQDQPSRRDWRRGQPEVGVMKVLKQRPAPSPIAKCGSLLARGAAVALMLALVGDGMTAARTRAGLDLPPLMLWAWDRDDDLRFLDPSKTGVAFLAATLTLRGEGVVLTPRHNPLALPQGVSRVAVAHVETDREDPPLMNDAQLRRFVEALATVGEEVPHRVLQIDFEAVVSQRAFLIDAIAALRARLPGAAISVTALASWCFGERWTARLEADEVVPMLFRMGYDGRRVRARLAGGGDFHGAECRSSLGIATDELPDALPPGRRVYVFSPRRWTAASYEIVRTRIQRWSHDPLLD
jgi:hypothetical protein